jgi:uncharacterized membrane protein YeaQ/YmgE (transglycosylase-associated protein family)
MGFAGWVVIGLLAGTLARAAVGSGQRSGCLFTMVVGVLGGVLGGVLFNAAGSRGIGDFGLWSMFVAFAGASLLLLVLRVVDRR